MRVTKGRVQVYVNAFQPKTTRNTHSRSIFHCNEGDTQMKNHGVSQWRGVGKDLLLDSGLCQMIWERVQGSRWRIWQSFMFPGDCLALLCLDNIHAFVRCSVMITDWFCFSPYPLWSQSGLVVCWCETVQVWQTNTMAWLCVSGQLLATPRPPWEHKVTS